LTQTTKIQGARGLPCWARTVWIDQGSDNGRMKLNAWSPCHLCCPLLNMGPVDHYSTLIAHWLRASYSSGATKPLGVHRRIGLGLAIQAFTAMHCQPK